MFWNGRLTLATSGCHTILLKHVFFSSFCLDGWPDCVTLWCHEILFKSAFVEVLASNMYSGVPSWCLVQSRNYHICLRSFGCLSFLCCSRTVWEVLAVFKAPVCWGEEHPCKCMYITVEFHLANYSEWANVWNKLSVCLASGLRPGPDLRTARPVGRRVFHFEWTPPPKSGEWRPGDTSCGSYSMGAFFGSFRNLLVAIRVSSGF